MMNLGRRVGISLAEKVSKARPRMTEDLDIIKFVCRELWTFLFKKQVDNLKTNHKGTFVLVDNHFRWLHRYGASSGLGSSGQEVWERQVWLPCGILEGVLHAFGRAASATAEVTSNPINAPSMSSPNATAAGGGVAGIGGFCVSFTIKVAPPQASVPQSAMISAMSGIAISSPSVASLQSKLQPSSSS
jgi:hypothetical protein